MTPAEFKEARQTLGLSAVQLVAMLRRPVSSDQAARNFVSKCERGVMPVPADTAELLRAYLWGYRPDDWPR